MIINARHKFIFVHIPKVAGTSISTALENIPGTLRHWVAGTKHETLAELQRHINTRRTIIDRLLSRSPENYYTFAFVRNPWDRMSSFYKYLVENRPKPEIDTVWSFKDFLQQAENGVAWIQDLYSMKSQLDYFTYNGGMMKLGFLGHYEYLAEDIASVAESIGHPIQLHHHNSSSNTGTDYRDEYDEVMIEIVRSIFSEEIEQFGYSFEKRYPTKRCSQRFESRR